MTNRRKIWGLGIVMASVLAACPRDFRALGDDPSDEGGSSSGGSKNKAGSGSVLPNGGKKSAPIGTAGSAPSSAGAPSEPGECFSPSEHLELALDPEGVGCECDSPETTCVPATDGDVPWFGAALQCVDGRWQMAPSGCNQACFSPTSSPELAIEPGGTGCACNDDPPECVRTMHQGRPWDVALYCVDGHWTSAEDGVCDGLAPGCKVDGVSYPSGARGVPSPLDACNTCDCNQGKLDNCTIIACADTVCDEGSSQARRCLGCGPVDNCTEYEIGCLSGEGCETGLCSSPWCG